MALDNVKDTIRKLLNLAENDGAADGEIDNALRFARRLMHQHHLSEEDIDRSDPDSKAAREDLWQFNEGRCYSEGKQMCSWERRLAVFICSFIGSVKCYKQANQPVVSQATGLKQYDEKGYLKTRGSIVFYGITDEVEVAQEMYDTWRTTIAAMARLRFGGALRGAGLHYGDGFVQGMEQRLRDAKHAETQEGDQTFALVVQSNAIAKRKQEKAEYWMAHVQGVKLQKAAPSYRSRRAAAQHAGAKSQGKADGRNADVNRPNVHKKLT